MVHGVRIRGGRAAYHNHFVRTSHYAQEKKLGYASFMKERTTQFTASTSLPSLNPKLVPGARSATFS